ncbi:MAG: hydroxymethylpyrimidine/phosphomethylpyrimidine kinase [Methylococcaceae bacterium]|nr:hydroxymethylpyrimidine/phosphomethylpyrimidine kinase [Methylococcaceae bacterium]
MDTLRPVVLCFSGHDPCGGAGIQADIEVLISHQCHAASVITVLTEQDTQDVKNLSPQTAAQFSAQARTVLADLSVKAIKIGLIGDYAIALAIHALLLEHPTIPVILDPILAAGGGASLADQRLTDAIVELLLPLSLIITPNRQEARQLSQLVEVNACGEALITKGCQYVLITGADEDTERPVVCNRLYQADKRLDSFNWDRLPGRYHGSGCTLAASIAALIAHGMDAFIAINEAQEYTWNTLNAAYQTGRGQLNPNRLFWVENEG